MTDVGNTFAIMPENAVRLHLAGISAITDLVGTDLYEIVLPDNFFKGPRIKQCLIVESNGGTSSHHSPMVQADLFVRCFGEDTQAALAVYSVVAQEIERMDNVDIDPSPNRIVEGMVTTLPQVGRDPDTGWWFVLIGCTIMMTNTG